MFFEGIQERVQNSRGKRVISVRAIEVFTSPGLIIIMLREYSDQTVLFVHASSCLFSCETLVDAGLRGAVGGRVSDSRARFDTRSGHILLFLLPLIQEGELSVTGESMCTWYRITTLEL